MKAPWTWRDSTKRGPSTGTADRGVPFDADQVDLVAVSGDGRCAVLMIVRAVPWTGSDAELDSLQLKIHNYVNFAGGGGMARQFPDTTGLPWRIQVDSQAGKPDRRTAAFLKRLREGVRRDGGDLDLRVWSSPDHP